MTQRQAVNSKTHWLSLATTVPGHFSGAAEWGLSLVPRPTGAQTGAGGWVEGQDRRAQALEQTDSRRQGERRAGLHRGLWAQFCRNGVWAGSKGGGGRKAMAGTITTTPAA